MAAHTAKQADNDLLYMTTEIVSAFVSRTELDPAKLPEAINVVFGALARLEANGSAARPDPAVPVAKSVTPGYLICLEDGRKLTMLKRYLRTTYDMTPEQYRARWGLPADYPMVAPNYSKKRSEFAKKSGLGRQPRKGAGKPGRKPKAKAKAKRA